MDQSGKIGIRERVSVFVGAFSERDSVWLLLKVELT